MYDLDFDSLPRILGHRMFKGLPPHIEEPLAKLKLPETLDRLRAASWFIDEVTPEAQDWVNMGYLRAGLSEFRSVKEALHWDLGDRSGYGPWDSHNPLIHLVYRLRRLAVYVANAPTEQQQVTATFEHGDKKLVTEFKILLIPDIERYVRLENLDAYRSEDISRLCEWFEGNQKVYGAPQVLGIGVALFCLELTDKYAARASLKA